MVDRMRRASHDVISFSGLADRLVMRRAEIEDAISNRVLAVASPPVAAGPEYVAGLRAAIVAGVALGIEAIRRGDQDVPRIPVELLEQARLAARSGVGLDTVLRRYLAGHALLGDFAVGEAEERVPPTEMKRLFRRLAGPVDRVLDEVTAAYTTESRVQSRDTSTRQAERIERLLAGEVLDADLGYDLSGEHVGIVVAGPQAVDGLRATSQLFGGQLLLVQRERDVVWAWLRSIEPRADDVLDRAIANFFPADAPLAVGEPGSGPTGWRMTHRQARAAFSIAERGVSAPVHYADVALVASVLQDDLLLTSLRRLYLEPFQKDRDGGTAIFETIRAYLKAGHSISAAASLLGVSRTTVSKRLQLVETRLSRSLDAYAADLDLALRLHTVERSTPFHW
jgi:DNA-binding transcriptional regulator YdaS (Cro superfamily)